MKKKFFGAKHLFSLENEIRKSVEQFLRNYSEVETCFNRICKMYALHGKIYFDLRSLQKITIKNQAKC